MKDALGLLGKLGDDAKILAGGHSLIPMMKLRLAQPKHLVDLRKVPGLAGIKEDKGIVIGAAFTHADLAHMVGATRQWVTISLRRLQEQGVVVCRKSQIIVRRLDALFDMRDAGSPSCPGNKRAAENMRRHLGN